MYHTVCWPSSHEYQNVPHMDISSNLWPGFVRSLKSIVRLFQCVLRCHGYSAAHTIDLQIKLFLCSPSLSLFACTCCMSAACLNSLLIAFAASSTIFIGFFVPRWSFIIFRFSSDAEILSHHLHLIPTFVFILWPSYHCEARNEKNNLN